MHVSLSAIKDIWVLYKIKSPSTFISVCDAVLFIKRNAHGLPWKLINDCIGNIYTDCDAFNCCSRFMAFWLKYIGIIVMIYSTIKPLWNREAYSHLHKFDLNTLLNLLECISLVNDWRLTSLLNLHYLFSFSDQLHVWINVDTHYSCLRDRMC